MKVTFATLAVAGLAAAQLEGVAPCVRSCIEAAFPKVGCTGTADQIAVCACKADTQTKILPLVTACATTNKCDAADLLKAQSIAAEQCKALATGGASQSGSATGSKTGSATGSQTESASASGSGSTTAVKPTLTTGTGGVPTNSLNQTTSGGATGTTKAPTNTQGGSGTGTGTGTTVPTSTGAAAGGPVVGALAAVLAAAFAL